MYKKANLSIELFPNLTLTLTLTQNTIYRSHLSPPFLQWSPLCERGSVDPLAVPRPHQICRDSVDCFPEFCLKLRKRGKKVLGESVAAFMYVSAHASLRACVCVCVCVCVCSCLPVLFTFEFNNIY